MQVGFLLDQKEKAAVLEQQFLHSKELSLRVAENGVCNHQKLALHKMPSL